MAANADPGQGERYGRTCPPARMRQAMQAHELMTTDVVTVTPEMTVTEAARVLLQHRISAAPVVDSNGTPVGMVSEGDLIGRSSADRIARRDWWLTLLADGEDLNPAFLNTLRDPQLTARDVLLSPLISIARADLLRAL